MSSNEIQITSGRLYKLKRRTFEILDGTIHDSASKACEIFIAVLVIANVLAIILESLQDLHDAYA